MTEREEIERTVRDIEVHDVHKDIATATVRSATYREYVHLVRTAEGWRIANALWQFT